MILFRLFGKRPAPEVPKPASGFTLFLGEFQGLGLILECSSDVFYTNQVGGYACHHPMIEGVFVPVNGLDLDWQALLSGLREPVLSQPLRQKIRAPEKPCPTQFDAVSRKL